MTEVVIIRVFLGESARKDARPIYQLIIEEAVISEHLPMQYKLCKRMLVSGDWFQTINLFCFRAVHGMPEVPILLQTQPEISRHAQNTG